MAFEVANETTGAITVQTTIGEPSRFYTDPDFTHRTRTRRKMYKSDQAVIGIDYSALTSQH